MHAVVITEPGEPDVLRWLEVPDPVPGPGEVVIDIAASGVNRADLMQRQGLLPAAAGRAAVPGPGVLGPGPHPSATASRAGGRVTRCARCWPAAVTPSRSWCPPGSSCRCPPRVDVTQAAAFPETACTVYANVFQLAGLASRRNAARARRQQRDRHHGDPARQGLRRPGRLHRGIGGEAGPLPRARRRRGHQLPGRGFRRGAARRHRRRGRRRDPRHHGRQLPGP